MDYNHIANFFEKFKKTLFKNEEYYEVIVQIIIKHISFPINIKSIKIKHNIIYIQSTPLIHNEILIHKNGILSDISNIFPDRKFIDIR